jgi:hypothetical protein
MKLELLDVLNWAWAGALAAGAWLWRELRSLRSDHSAVVKDIAAYRTHLAEKYVTKDDLNVVLNRVYDALERIECKLDGRS